MKIESSRRFRDSTWQVSVVKGRVGQALLQACSAADPVAPASPRVVLSMFLPTSCLQLLLLLTASASAYSSCSYSRLLLLLTAPAQGCCFCSQLLSLIMTPTQLGCQWCWKCMSFRPSVCGKDLQEEPLPT